jgi:hypothetical protein
MFFLLFLHDDRRIRIQEAQKHVDPVDPDSDQEPQHWMVQMQAILAAMLSRREVVVAMLSRREVVEVVFGPTDVPSTCTAAVSCTTTA